jgi:hypothetical protein
MYVETLKHKERKMKIKQMEKPDKGKICMSNGHVPQTCRKLKAS